MEDNVRRVFSGIIGVFILLLAGKMALRVIGNIISNIMYRISNFFDNMLFGIGNTFVGGGLGTTPISAKIVLAVPLIILLVVGYNKYEFNEKY